MSCTHVRIQKFPSGGGGVLKMFFCHQRFYRGPREAIEPTIAWVQLLLEGVRTRVFKES